MRITVLSLLASLSLLAPLSAQDTKGTADALSRVIRQQHFDGERYGDLRTTCRVLDALARSPRRYNEMDGPWLRKAAEWVSTQPIATADDAAWKALALAGSITGRLGQARNAALRQVSGGAGGDEYLALLALATLDAEAAGERGLGRFPGSSDPAAQGHRSGLAVLRATDPVNVVAPDLQPAKAWLAWARAARLRGLDIAVRPELPTVDPDASLDRLVDDLNLVIALHGLPTQGAETDDDEAPPPPERMLAGRGLDETLEAAWGYLSDSQQDGTWGMGRLEWKGPQSGITAMNLSASIWLADRLGRERPEWIDDGLDYLVSLAHDDGSIHEGGLAVYTTSVAIEALIDGGRETDAEVIERARRFVLAAQSDEGEGYDPLDDPHYGGIGYGGDERPDLSNTQMALEAAALAGTPPGDPLFTKAMGFLVKHQNLAEEQVFRWKRPQGGTIISGTDGGATYMPGNSPAGEDDLGNDLYRARSYGTMTFALTKSYLLCGLSADDRRVAAALRWLADHYTLDVNPGYADPSQAAQGLYYYYQAMARTLARLGDDDFVDADGRPIPWRADLARRLADEQRTDGSWFNERASRWWESSPTLCTGYALLALKASAEQSPRQD